MSLRDQLQAVYEDRKQLTPADVLEVASDPDHPLHARFEWDDTAAAGKWRQHQAHELIRSVKIAYIDGNGHPADVRAFHAVRTERGHVYEPVEEVAANELTTKLLLQDMEREWRTLRRRWEGFEQFTALVRRDVDAA